MTIPLWVSNEFCCANLFPRSFAAVDKIRAGNPCEKAERLKVIKESAASLPKTDILSNQLQNAVRRHVENASDHERRKNPSIDLEISR